MKIDDRRLFTYPVLAAGRDDYKTCNFSAEMKISSDDANNFVLEINFSTDCAEINRLIEGGEAKYLLHIECPATLYRKIFTSSLGKLSAAISLNSIREKLYWQKFFADKSYLRFEDNYHECKENDNYNLLQSNMAQQTLRAVDFAFKSFFATVGKIKGVRPPHYRKKGGLYTLTITGNSISIRDGFLTVPQSRLYSSLLNNHRIKIRVPERLSGKTIHEVKIIPLYKGRAFKIAYCYEVDE